MSTTQEEINSQNGIPTTNSEEKGVAYEVVKEVKDLTDQIIGKPKDIEVDIPLEEKIAIAMQISPIHFQNFILDQIKKSQAITNGQEGEIFKIEIEGKEYIIAKKRFDTLSKSEFKLHEEAYRISLQSNSGVKVPKPIHEFSDENNGYIIMEYIEGRTLYTMIWEEIVNSKLIPLINKLINREINNGNLIAKKYKGELENIITQYKDEKGAIVFNNDYDTQSGMDAICGILYDLGEITGTFNSFVTNPGNPSERIYTVERELLDKYLGQISLFKEKEKIEVSKKLKVFLNDLHKQGFYHRDVGKNFRNIMFNGTDIYIIDFGRSIKIKGNKGESYDYENGTMTNDNDLIANINKTKNKEDIKESIEKINNIDLLKYLDDLIAGKDKLYNWFIYLNYTPGSYEEQSTNRGKDRLRTIIKELDENKLTFLKEKITEYLKSRKNTKKYKYAKLFDEYIKKGS